MKAVILAAGIGSRLRPVTLTMPKPLVPVANKRLIQYAIERAKRAGISEIGIVVHTMESPIVSTYGDGSSLGVKLSYIVQTEQLGLAHACKTAQEFVDGDDFAMILGDNVFQDDMEELLSGFSASDAEATIVLGEVPDPERFGVAVTEGDKITYMVEKDPNPPSNLAIAGLYCFRPSIFEAIDKIEPSARGEYEITDAIYELIKADKKVAPYAVKGWWIDAGKPDPIVLANQLVLEELPWTEAPTEKDDAIENSDVTHRVILGKNVKIINSYVRGPVIIGDNTVIRDSYVGPYTSIGSDTVIENAEVDNSIIMDEVTIKDVDRRLDRCLIAHKATVTGSKNSVQRLILSEYAKVEI